MSLVDGAAATHFADALRLALLQLARLSVRRSDRQRPQGEFASGFRGLGQTRLAADFLAFLGSQWMSGMATLVVGGTLAKVLG